MKQKWSKWKFLTIYSYNSVEFILLAKINKKNGDIKTKSIKLHGRMQYTQTEIFKNTFDANKHLIDLLNEK